MEYKAILNNYRMSPRKVRLVADVVRQKSVVEAVDTLNHLHKKSSEPIRKLIQSAAANAKNLDQVMPDSLFVEKIFVDEGPTMRRFRPRAFGRAFMIRKRSCKVTVVLNTKAKVKHDVKTPKPSQKSTSEQNTSKAQKPTAPKKTSTTSKKTTK